MGAYVFTKRHLDQLRYYFVQVRRGPTPMKQVDFPTEGHYDSLRRLERQQEIDAIIERFTPPASR